MASRLFRILLHDESEKVSKFEIQVVKNEVKNHISFTPREVQLSAVVAWFIVELAQIAVNLVTSVVFMSKKNLQTRIRTNLELRIFESCLRIPIFSEPLKLLQTLAIIYYWKIKDRPGDFTSDD